MIRNLFFLFLTVMLSSSCNKTLNPSIMFQTPSDFNYTIDNTIANVEYRLSPYDIIEFSIYSNDGEKLLERSIAASSTTGPASLGTQVVNEQGVKYMVDMEGLVKLPQIGRIKLKDMTIREAEKFLEEKYSQFIKKPFAILKVTNRRVIVFTGSGGMGSVVNLENENTTLIEALARAGGITTTGKARKIKLIRGDTHNPQVQLIDLSTVEGMKQSNLMLQANDIIYVEPVPRISQGILAEITPIASIIASGLLIYNFVQQISK